MKKKDPFISAEKCTNNDMNAELRSLRAKLVSRGGDSEQLLSELIDCLVINLNLYLQGDLRYKENVMEVYNALTNINILFEFSPKHVTPAINKALKDYYDEMCGAEVSPERSLVSTFMGAMEWMQSVCKNAISSAVVYVSFGDAKVGLMGSLPKDPFNDPDPDLIN